MNRAAIYCRVSSEEQVKGHSLDIQNDGCTKAALDAGYTISPAHVYVDAGFSATSDKRPAFQTMISAAKIKEFDRIYVWKLDRFARSREDSIVYKGLLKKAGVELISVQEPLDDSPGSYVLEGVMEVIAGWYSVDLKKKVSDAKAKRAKERGLPNSHIAPFGYAFEYTRDGAGKVLTSKLAINEEERPIVCFVLESYVAGALSHRALANAVMRRWPNARTHNIARKVTKIFNGKHNVDLVSGPRAFTVASVISIIRNANLYSGLVSYKGEWFAGQHEPIIDPTFAARVEAISGTRRMAPYSGVTRPINQFLFTRLIRCFACESRLAQVTTRGRKSYRGEQRARMGDCRVCRGRYIAERTIEADLFPVLEELASLKREEIEGALLKARPEITDDYNKRVSALKAKRRRLTVAYVDNPSGDDEDEESYKTEIASIDRELEALTPAPVAQVRTVLDDPLWDLVGDRRPTTTAGAARETLSIEELRQFYARLVNAIFIDLDDKERPIRFIAPTPELRPFGKEQVYVGERVVGETAEVILSDTPLRGVVQSRIPSDSSMPIHYKESDWKPLAIVR